MRRRRKRRSIRTMRPKTESDDSVEKNRMKRGDGNENPTDQSVKYR